MSMRFLSSLVLALSLLSFPAFSQTESDAALLGLPGDNLDLYAVLDLFQQSKTIEDFEKSLNLEETGINNLDLNLDSEVDFIKVATEAEGDDFTFVLQVDVSEKEIQDVAVILVSRDENEKITMQIVGDKDLYGKDYVVEPAPPTPAVTANPAYTGANPVGSAPAITNVVVVESTPIVQYVYSPVYVPYYPPYYYGYYPPYHATFTVVAVSAYHHNNYHHHNGYHGGHGNTVVIHNNNNYNNYNNSRNSSNTVNRNNASSNYNKSSPSTRPSTSPSTRPSTTPSTRPSTTPSTRPSTTPSSSASRSMGSSTRPSPSSSASRPTPSSRPTGGGGGGRRR